jgi:regulator of RNase E activity RraA
MIDPRVIMPSYRSIPAADLELLRKFDSPTVCNVIELFDCRPRTRGYMDSRIRACFPAFPPMVGYASTATFRSASAPPAGSAYASLADQVNVFAELPGPAVVVFQDLDSPTVAATFGEVMCTSYKAFGAVGLITSGAARDLEQVEALGFPCFSNGVICAHGYCHILQLHVPIHVGGVTVAPGDLIHGDCNGVTTIPNVIASAVAQACPEFVAAESVVLDYAREGRVDQQGYAAALAECRSRVDALARKLKLGK